MKRFSWIFPFIVLTIISHAAKAQDKEQVLKDWQRAKGYTLHYLQAMPEKDYNFKPTPEMRTFAEHMLHFTDANFELAPLAGGLTSPLAPGAAGKSEKSKDAVIKMVTDGYDFVISNITNMKPAQFQDTIKLFNKYTMSKGTLLSKIFEHQTHHRGQTTVYFHLVGVKPPDEELF
jgi:uncharacterized damage-inducible protein DinB